MKPVVKKATPAAIAVLRQATAIAPLRLKASDGLLPSKEHQLQNPDSDHNTGHAVDLTHDVIAGIDCNVIFEKLQADPRVDYLIFKGKIWSKDKGLRVYKGSNKHTKHLHISIKQGCGGDTSPWFAWLGKPKKVNTIKAAVRRLPNKHSEKAV